MQLFIVLIIAALLLAGIAVYAAPSAGLYGAGGTSLLAAGGAVYLLVTKRT